MEAAEAAGALGLWAGGVASNLGFFRAWVEELEGLADVDDDLSLWRRLPRFDSL